jgi:hypothetical protein
VLNTFTGTGEKRIVLSTRGPRPRNGQDPRGPGGGPVIDV